nr:hypothetical protein GCM10020092_099960 [Actinoplanes digitatis]
MIDPVVGLDWVRERGDRVVLADVRWYLDGRSGRAAYESGHLPGAVFVDLDRWLARHGSADGGRHPLPEPEVFAQGMAAVGIGDGDVVVGYDDAGGVVAARLVWMLRAIGHEAALLDGGLSAYEGELVRDEPDRPAGGLHRAGLALPTGWPASMMRPTGRPWCSTPATVRGSGVTPSRSIRGRGTFRVRAACRAGRISPMTAVSWRCRLCGSVSCPLA